MRKSIPGWEGFYEVDEQGSIWSLPRTVTRSDGSMQRWPGQQLKTFSNAAGYLIVRLSRPGLRKMARVHRIVAETFLPNPCGLPEVNHLDGVRSNAKASNLEWCTPSGNRHHAFHVLGSIKMPENGKLSQEIAHAIREEHVAGICGYKRLAKKYGVNPSCIRDILKQRAYKLPPPPTTSAGSGKGE